MAKQHGVSLKMNWNFYLKKGFAIQKYDVFKVDTNAIQRLYYHTGDATHISESLLT